MSLHVPMGPLDDVVFTAFGVVGTTWGETVAFSTCVVRLACREAESSELADRREQFGVLSGAIRNLRLVRRRDAADPLHRHGPLRMVGMVAGGVQKTPLPLSKTTPQQWKAIAGFTAVAMLALTLILDHCNLFHRAAIRCVHHCALAGSNVDNLTRRSSRGGSALPLMSFISRYTATDLWLTACLYRVSQLV